MCNSALFARILERAERTPEAFAVVVPGGVSVSYSGLTTTAVSRAKSLLQKKFRPGHRILSTLLDSSDVAASLMAASAAQCSYVPLNPKLSVDEFERYLRVLRPAALLAERGRSFAATDAARSLGVPILEPHGDSFEFAGESTTTLPSEPAGIDDEAIVFLTSGTTSRPKVVPHSSAGITLAAQLLARGLELQPDDRCLVLSPIYNASGLNGGVLASLATGASFFAPTAFQPADVFRWLKEWKPTWISAPPALYQAIMDFAVRHPDVPRTHYLRFVRSVGAHLAGPLREQVERLLNVRFVQTYGMSEAPPIAMEPRRPDGRKPGAIGPSAGPEIAIRDSGGKDQLHGTEGEIWVRGGNVATCYWNDPEATRAAFRDGWFRTGDLGRLDADGYLYLTGRNSETINRGGEKIAPSEVEEVLAAHPAVRDVAVFSLPDPVLGEEIAAAVVVANPVAAVELQRFAAARLAAHKIPRRILFLDAIPRNATGKALRAQIAESIPMRDRPLAFEKRGAETATEKLLVELCQHTLKIEGISANSHFFDIGGSSLDAASFLARVSEARGLPPIEPAVLLWAPRLSELAVLVDHPPELILRGNLIPLQRRGHRPPLVILGVGPFYRHVLAQLGDDQPVYAIRVPNLASAPELNTFEKIAGHCVSVLENAALRGPAVLVGWCVDGMLALETARQALERGLDVPAVVLIDARGLAGKQRSAAAKNIRKAQFHARRLLSLRSTERLRYVAALLGTAARKGLGPASPPDSSALILEAWRRFTPRYFDGRAIHLWAQDRPAGDNLEGWENIAAGVELVEVPGDHVTVFEKENAASFAAAFRSVTSIGAAVGA